MARFTASQLDLSRFAGFKLVNVDYEAIRAARLAALRARLQAAGIPYDVETVESDPAVILQEEDSYREALDLQAINDTGLGLTLAFAQGTALDLIGETYFATARMVVTPANETTGGAAVMESDARYRRRIQLAPEAFSGGGTPGGYVYSALTADPRVKDANCYIDAPGTGNVFVSIIENSGNGAVSDSLFAAVRAHVLSDSQRLATDNVTIVRATIIPYSVTAHIVLPPGVSPATAVTAATERFNAEAAARHVLDMPVPRSAIASALHIANAIRVDVSSPAADINPGPAGAAFCTGLTLTTSIYGDAQ